MFWISNLLSLINAIRGSLKECDDVETSENPDESRTPKNSYLDGMVHIFRSTVGTAILALPSAFSRVGYASGIVGVILVTYIANYCAVILVSCQKELSRRNKGMVISYQATIQAAFESGPKSLRNFGPTFMAFTNLSILVGQIGVLSIYIVFIASNIKAALDKQFDIDLRYYELMVYFAMANICLVPNLKKLAIVSSFGNIVILISVAVVFYFFLRDPISLEGKIAFGSFKEFPQFVGTIFFSCAAITLVLPVQAEMKQPDQLDSRFGVLNVTAFMCAILYIFFGVFGYLRYGDDAAGSITLNLPPGEILGQSAQILLAFSTLSSSPLVNYIAVSMIWNDYLDKRLIKYRSITPYVLRLLIVTFTLLIAVLVPNLKVLFSVLGVIIQCTLSTTLPCLVHVLTYYQQPNLWEYICTFWVDAVAMILTTVVFFWSLSSTLMMAAIQT